FQRVKNFTDMQHRNLTRAIFAQIIRQKSLVVWQSALPHLFVGQKSSLLTLCGNGGTRILIIAIKKLFGVYEENREYWVYTKKIKVPPEFRATGIRKKKLNRKMDYWNKNGTFESKVILDNHYNLL